MKFYIKYPARTTQKIVRAWQHIASDIFDRSQDLVPVLTGYLKDSGSLTHIANGSIIRYSAKYASIQEIGRASGQTSKVPAAMIQSHSRGTKSGGTTTVKKYYRSSFTTTSSVSIKGKFYLTRAYDEFKPQLNAALSKYIPDNVVPPEKRVKSKEEKAEIKRKKLEVQVAKANAEALKKPILRAKVK